MKIGDVRYSGYIDDETGKIDVDEYVLRSIQNRRLFNKYHSNNARVKYAYWIQKSDGVTWVKRSTKTGDYGWADKFPEFYRCRQLVENGAPYSASKRGAIRELLAETRQSLRDGEDDQGEDFLPLSTLIKKLETYQKRMKKG